MVPDAMLASARMTPTFGPAHLPDLGVAVRAGWDSWRRNLVGWYLNLSVVLAIWITMYVMWAIYFHMTSQEDPLGLGLVVRDPIPVLEVGFLGLFFLVAITTHYVLCRVASSSVRNEALTPMRLLDARDFASFVVLDVAIIGLVACSFVVPIIGTLVAFALFLFGPFIVLTDRVSPIAAIADGCSLATRPGAFMPALLLSAFVSVASLLPLFAFAVVTSVLGASGLSADWNAFILLAGVGAFVVASFVVWPITVSTAAAAHLHVSPTGTRNA